MSSTRCSTLQSLSLLISTLSFIEPPPFGLSSDKNFVIIHLLKAKTAPRTATNKPDTAPMTSTLIIALPQIQKCGKYCLQTAKFVKRKSNSDWVPHPLPYQTLFVKPFKPSISKPLFLIASLRIFASFNRSTMAKSCPSFCLFSLITVDLPSIKLIV